MFSVVSVCHFVCSHSDLHVTSACHAIGQLQVTWGPTVPTQPHGDLYTGAILPGTVWKVGGWSWTERPFCYSISTLTVCESNVVSRLVLRMDWQASKKTCAFVFAFIQCKRTLTEAMGTQQWLACVTLPAPSLIVVQRQSVLDPDVELECDTIPIKQHLSRPKESPKGCPGLTNFRLKGKRHEAMSHHSDGILRIFSSRRPRTSSRTEF